LKVNSIFAPVVAINDQFVLLPEERMERVRHPKRWSPAALMRCIRRLVPKGKWSRA
jgi:hypothetical protein